MKPNNTPRINCTKTPMYNFSKYIDIKKEIKKITPKPVDTEIERILSINIGINENKRANMFTRTIPHLSLSISIMIDITIRILINQYKMNCLLYEKKEVVSLGIMIFTKLC